MRRRMGFRLLSSLVIAGALAGAAWAGLSNSVFYGTQLRFSDALFPSGTADPGIVVVAIDDKSLTSVGQRWPWDRGVHADLISQLAADGAASIGYDVTFGQRSESEASDTALIKAVEHAGNVVLGESVEFPHTTPGEILKADQVFKPFDDLRNAAAGVGHVNVYPDTDGVTRALPPVIEDEQGGLLPSLSFALFERQLGVSGPITVRPEGFQVGSTLVATGPAHLMDINYVDFARSQIIPASEVLDGTVDPGRIRGHIVLVGATAQGLQDFKQTPLDKSQGQPGVLVHANALDTMLSAGYLYPESKGTTTLNVGIITLLIALAVMFLWLWVSPLVLVGVIAGFGYVAFQRFDDRHVMNLVYPVLGAIVAYVAALGVKYFTEVRERRRVTEVFGRYVAPDVVDEVLAAPGKAVATLKGAARPLSILFADLRGFTSASEDASPHDVVEALNVYLDAMTRAVLEEKGTIDKFMGDCVMAFWGAPKEEPQHAMKAIRAAKRMQDLIDEAMGNGSAASRLKVKGCGVGVSTGAAVVGNIGSVDRLDYTVIGDTVNTASRLCGVAGPGQIVVTSETAREVSKLDHDLRLSELPPLVVKGKSEPLRVYQVLREGQDAIQVKEGEVTVMVEEKGRFEPEETQPAPPKVAGYAPVEPVPAAAPSDGDSSSDG